MSAISCQNCGTQRADSFCPHCGQNDRNYQRAFPPMLWELLRETFDLDSKVIHTIVALLFKPGQLALEFSRNRRARYVSPIRLYLFISLAFFFILSVTTDFDAGDGIVVETEPAAVEEATSSENKEAAANEHYEAPDEGYYDLAANDDYEASVNDSDIDALLKILPAAQHEYIQEVMGHADEAWDKQAIANIATMVAEQNAPLSPAISFVVSQIINAISDPTAARNQMLDNLPIAMFLLLPIFAVLLKLFYYGRHKYYVEHLVFATHLHSFAFIVYIFMLLIPTAPQSLMLGILTVYHMIALKRYYASSYAGTIFKFTTQMAVYFTVLIPTVFVALLLMTLLTV